MYQGLVSPNSKQFTRRSVEPPTLWLTTTPSNQLSYSNFHIEFEMIPNSNAPTKSGTHTLTQKTIIVTIGLKERFELATHDASNHLKYQTIAIENTLMLNMLLFCLLPPLLFASLLNCLCGYLELSYSNLYFMLISVKSSK